MTEECFWKGEGKVQNVPMVPSVGGRWRGCLPFCQAHSFSEAFSTVWLGDLGERQKEEAASPSWNLDIWGHLGPSLTLPGPQPAFSITSLSFSRLFLST